MKKGEPVVKGPDGKFHGKLLITGCGRSGTSHIARMLRMAGVNMPHESMGHEGSVCWYCGNDGGVVPAGGTTGKFLRTNHQLMKELPSECEYEQVALQVRYPLKTIASVMTCFTALDWAYINRAVPEIVPVGPGGVGSKPEIIRVRIRRAMLYWHWWNLRIEERAVKQWRLEELNDPERREQLWAEIMELLGRDEPMPVLPEGTRTNRNTGYRTPPKLTWDMLQQVDVHLCKLIKEQGRRYGYEIP